MALPLTSHAVELAAPNQEGGGHPRPDPDHPGRTSVASRLTRAGRSVVVAHTHNHPARPRHGPTRIVPRRRTGSGTEPRGRREQPQPRRPVCVIPAERHEVQPRPVAAAPTADPTALEPFPVRDRRWELVVLCHPMNRNRAGASCTLHRRPEYARKNRSFFRRPKVHLGRPAIAQCNGEYAPHIQHAQKNPPRHCQMSCAG